MLSSKFDDNESVMKSITTEDRGRRGINMVVRGHKGDVEGSWILNKCHKR
jgi:hypothetical protein